VRSVRLHPKAREEIAGAVVYLEQQRPDYGTIFSNEIDAGIKRIIGAPDRWSMKAAGFRKYLAQRFKYLIWYRETEDEIYIIAVHHSARKPGYWKQRILDDEQR
jgi:plasmid stabilization system protein ParE